MTLLFYDIKYSHFQIPNIVIESSSSQLVGCRQLVKNYMYCICIMIYFFYFSEQYCGVPSFHIEHTTYGTRQEMSLTRAVDTRWSVKQYCAAQLLNSGPQS